MDTNNPFAALLGSAGSGGANERQPDNNDRPKNAAAATDEAKRINDLIENVFAITLTSTPRSYPILFVDPVDSPNPNATLHTIEMFENILFERLLLLEPHTSVIPKADDGFAQSEDIFTHQVIIYLFNTYTRLIEYRQVNLPLGRQCDKLEELIIRNASTAMKQPMVYENQSMSDQWLDIFKRNPGQYIEEKRAFLSKIVADIYKDDSIDEEAIKSIFQKIFDECYQVAKLSSLDRSDEWLLLTIQSFVADRKNPQLAELLLNYSTPQTSGSYSGSDGRAFSNSLLGLLLSVNLMPKEDHYEYEYFKDARDREASVYTDLLYTRLSRHLDEMTSIFKSFLLIGGQTRTKILNWLGECLKSNISRRQTWSNNQTLMNVFTASDSFALGLCGMLLRLCKPLLRPDYKVLDVDPTYYAVGDADRSQKNVHMISVDKETCLIPCEDGEQRKSSDSYNFITEIFFMTHQAIELSYCICYQKFVVFNRDVSTVQNQYRDSLQSNQSSWDENRVRSMELQIQRYLCFKQMLIEPSNDRLLLSFYEATSKWLVKCAANRELDSNELQLPLHTTAPKCLASIPECIFENMATYLVFVQYFQDLHIHMDREAKYAIFTVILIFMGDSTRARNPHLRARLAEAMESFLPANAEIPYSENLFAEHPHRNDTVRNIISVFVAIEMTGQNVQFEQKFNYRRPMYKIMKYLWKMEEHKECFRQLSQQAIEHIDAVQQPLFLRFINLLINDAIFLLDESLSNMQQIQQLEHAQDSSEWATMTTQEREQNRTEIRRFSLYARSNNILGQDTISTLSMLTNELADIFCHSSMVDRIVAMLNYFLRNFVGPDQRKFIVRDKAQYHFHPDQTVYHICGIYKHLSSSNAFCLAVSQDGRSYTPRLFSDTLRVLAKIGAGPLIPDITELAEKVEVLARQEEGNQEALADPPDDYLDPIMSTLMTDPVILPTSNAIVDRTTIARHLLSDQTDPFNRSPLTMDQVKSNVELKAEIHAWIAKRKAEYKSSSSK